MGLISRVSSRTYSFKKMTFHRHLTFSQAARLRNYRHDQYSIRDTKLVWANRWRRSTWMNLVSTPLKDLVGTQCFRRSIIQQGTPYIHNKKYKDSLLWIKKQPPASQTNSAKYRKTTNLDTIFSEEINSSSKDKPQRLLNELPLEYVAHANDRVAAISNMGVNPKQHLNDRLVFEFVTQGCKNRRNYALCVTYYRQHRRRGDAMRDVIEQVGSFDPIPNRFGYKLCGVNFERVKYWVAAGIDMDPRVRRLLGLSGIIPISPETIIAAKRLRERKEMEDLASKWVEENLEQDEVD